MVHTQNQLSKLFARDIAAYSDTELDQYLSLTEGRISDAFIW